MIRVDVGLGDGLEQRVLVLEAEIDRADRNAGFGCDVAEFGAAIAQKQCGKQIGGRPKERIADARDDRPKGTDEIERVPVGCRHGMQRKPGRHIARRVRDQREKNQRAKPEQGKTDGFVFVSLAESPLAIDIEATHTVEVTARGDRITVVSGAAVIDVIARDALGEMDVTSGCFLASLS